MNARILEETIDELMFYFRYATRDEIKYFMVMARNPSVIKYYKTVYLAASDSLLGLAKRFVGKVRDIHKSKARTQL